MGSNISSPGGNAALSVEAQAAPTRADIKDWMVNRVAETLQVSPEEIDAGQPFTTFGLESLDAFSIAGELADWLGRDLSATLLWEYPTIEALALHLAGEERMPDGENEQATVETESSQPSWLALRPIQPQGTRPPFYCMHGMGGSVLWAGNLARHLGADQPVFAFQFPMPADGELSPCSVHEAATLYVRELLQFQTQGPYFLGGLSYGGVIAFEMAHQLRAQGHEVAFLALLDSFCPQYGRQLPAWRRLQLHTRILFQRPPREQLKYMRSLAAGLHYRMRKRLGFTADRLARRWEKPMPKVFQEIHVINHAASNAYHPQPYSGPVTLFRAMDCRDAAYDPQRGWQHVTPTGLEVQPVPGDHSSFNTEPHVQVLAERLDKCLRRAQTL